MKLEQLLKPIYKHHYCLFVASQAFPYVKKRIPVVSHSNVDMSPIQVAIEEMTKKVSSLREVVFSDAPDMKKLQLQLQGL